MTRNPRKVRKSEVILTIKSYPNRTIYYYSKLLNMNAESLYRKMLRLEKNGYVRTSPRKICCKNKAFWNITRRAQEFLDFMGYS